MASLDAINAAKKKAQDNFNQQRVAKLSISFFPNEVIHPEFKGMLQKLLKFNSARQMNVNPKTWENMCTFQREFFMPEMDVCIEILLRSTPNEIVSPFRLVEDKENPDFVGAVTSELKTDEQILEEYNKVQYPKILEILKPMREAYINIDKQISIPIANKINSDAKIALQLPIGTSMSFVNTPTFS